MLPRVMARVFFSTSKKIGMYPSHSIKNGGLRETSLVMQREIGGVSGGNNFIKKGEMVYLSICSYLLRATNTYDFIYRFECVRVLRLSLFFSRIDKVEC